ncbi:MAG: PAS domain-containing protein [Lachnospiraceae bacterium]|nr:PAS domain-containing protein [Lachnospiraceae bacterium]
MREETKKAYCRLSLFLSAALGPDYEILLCDLEKILAIQNDYISGRTPGSELPDMIKALIKNETYKEANWKVSYQDVTESGKVLRSSVLFIYDENKDPEGVLCINFDDSRYKELADTVFHLCHPDSYVQRNIKLTTDRSAEPETFYADMKTVTEDIIKHVVNDPKKDPNDYTYEEKLEIVRQLYSNGIFSLKGAIPSISERISCSQASVYRYISAVKEEEQN